jgi:hypothetical protein
MDKVQQQKTQDSPSETPTEKKATTALETQGSMESQTPQTEDKKIVKENNECGERIFQKDWGGCEGIKKRKEKICSYFFFALWLNFQLFSR